MCKGNHPLYVESLSNYLYAKRFIDGHSIEDCMGGSSVFDFISKCSYIRTNYHQLMITIDILLELSILDYIYKEYAQYRTVLKVYNIFQDTYLKQIPFFV